MLSIPLNLTSGLLPVTSFKSRSKASATYSTYHGSLSCSTYDLLAILGTIYIGIVVYFSALMLLVGWQEDHLARKKLECSGACMVICLERGANNLHMAYGLLMPLPPTPSSLLQQNSEWFILLILAHPGSLGQRVINR